MKALLICPSERPNVKLLGEQMPLANISLLGQNLLEYWLAYLASSGVKQVAVLAHDRPEYVETVVGNGARWGLIAKVIIESRELTPAQALLKHQLELNAAPLPNGIGTLDQFPGQSQGSLFGSYADFFKGLLNWMPLARTPDRVGVYERRPGIWTGLHSHISPEATLRAPCWIGRKVFIGAGAIVGPNTVIEDGSFIEPSAEVADSFVGPDTFVGRYSELRESIAWGSTLANWNTNSVTTVPDAFVLCALRTPRRLQPDGWLTRVMDCCSRNKEDLQMVWKHFLMDKEG